MEELISTIITAFTSSLDGLAGGLVSGAETLVYGATSGDSKVLTTLIVVVFTLTGFSIAFAVVKWLLGLLKIS